MGSEGTDLGCARGVLSGGLGARNLHLEQGSLLGFDRGLLRVAFEHASEHERSDELMAPFDLALEIAQQLVEQAVIAEGGSGAGVGLGAQVLAGGRMHVRMAQNKRQHTERWRLSVNL